MSALGYDEGKNLAIDWRYADGDYQRLDPFAAGLVAANPQVIVGYGTAAAKALKAATSTIPIVVVAGNDLVGSGIVRSLARPGGNITGLSVADVDVSGKQLDLLKIVLPRLSRAAVLINPGNPANLLVQRQLERSAPRLAVEIVPVDAGTPDEIDEAFESAAQQGAGGLIVAADAFFSGQGVRIARAGLRQRLATISTYQDHVTAGCVMSYGQNLADFHRQTARYVDRILKGAKPADLPIDQPTKFEFALNTKTATALGLDLPRALVASADLVE
jgi:putative tryptophan/tyrosine transport system substrate-binding protein